MGLFETTVVKAKELWDITEEKVGEALDVQKIKINIARTKAELSKDYEVLGRLWFSQQKNENVDAEAMSAIVEEIELLQDNLREYEAELTFAKGGTVCDACGAANSADSDFCRKCGKPL